MNPLYLDIETTGLIPKGAEWRTDFEQYPYIVSVAWWFDSGLYEYIIKPDGYEIPIESTVIHNITHARAAMEGHNLLEVLKRLLLPASEAEAIIGHGLYFDTSIIKANVLRNGWDIEPWDEAFNPTKRYDTMRKTMKLCGLKQQGSNRPKWPSLAELYWFLFEEELKDAHTSGADVMAVRRCYEEVMRLEDE